MKNTVLLLIIAMSLAGCSITNPPPPKQPSGKWETINTTLEDIKVNNL